MQIASVTQVPREYPIANLVAFDVFIHNVDRRKDNPNLLMKRAELIAIDHGDAFAFAAGLIGAPDPVHDHLPDLIERHPLREPLRGRMPSLQKFGDRLSRLTDELLEKIAAATPAAWRTGPAKGKLEEIVDVLRKRRDAAPLWLPKVAACVM
jgi:hypothetical protein